MDYRVMDGLEALEVSAIGITDEIFEFRLVI